MKWHQMKNEQEIFPKIMEQMNDNKSWNKQ